MLLGEESLTGGAFSHICEPAMTTDKIHAAGMSHLEILKNFSRVEGVLNEINLQRM